MASGRPGPFGSVRTWQRTARRALTPDLRWMWPSGRSSPRLVGAARCPVRRAIGGFDAALDSGAVSLGGCWFPGRGSLGGYLEVGLLVRAGAGGRPGVVCKSRGTRWVHEECVARRDCVLIGTGSVPVPAATVEVAVLGVAPEDRRPGACSAVGGFWLRSRKRRRTGCVQEKVSCSVWTRSLIGVLLGAVARVAYRLAAHRGCCSVRANGASARTFYECAPPCARSPALYRRAAVCGS